MRGTSEKAFSSMNLMALFVSNLNVQIQLTDGQLSVSISTYFTTFDFTAAAASAQSLYHAEIYQTLGSKIIKLHSLQLLRHNEIIPELLLLVYAYILQHYVVTQAYCGAKPQLITRILTKQSTPLLKSAAHVNKTPNIVFST